MCVVWNQFNIFPASAQGQLFVLCRNWGKNVGPADLAQLTVYVSQPCMYSNAADCGGVFLITTPKHAHSSDLFMQWTFFVQFHFTEHEVLLGEGEKWGEGGNKTKGFTYLWARGKKREGFTSTSKSSAF